MKILELFCGTKSFSKVAEKHRHECITVDINPSFNPTYVMDLSIVMNQLGIMDIINDYDLIWMSPPCTTFSMASGNTHWTSDRKPKTEQAKEGKALLLFCESVAKECIRLNKLYIIENPRARARWFLPIADRQTAWYCQYGDKRAKPTDIWTNVDIKFRTCHNGNTDHDAAPRGSRTGTQGMKQTDRYRIPAQLCEEILDCILKGRK